MYGLWSDIFVVMVRRKWSMVGGVMELAGSVVWLITGDLTHSTRTARPHAQLASPRLAPPRPTSTQSRHAHTRGIVEARVGPGEQVQTMTGKYLIHCIIVAVHQVPVPST